MKTLLWICLVILVGAPAFAARDIDGTIAKACVIGEIKMQHDVFSDLTIDSIISHINDEQNFSYYVFAIDPATGKLGDILVVTVTNDEIANATLEVYGLKPLAINLSSCFS